MIVTNDTKLRDNFSKQEISSLLQTFPKGAVFFDLETTGLSPINDAIIEIGALKVHNSQQVDRFKTFVHPERVIPEENIKIHKITNEMVADAPKLRDVLPDFLKFCGDLPLIAHNAQFDIGFIAHGIHNLKLNFPNSTVYDSCRFIRQMYLKNKKSEPENQKRPENFKLATLAEYFSINNESHHRALDDANTCMKVFCGTLLEKNQKELIKFCIQKSYLYQLNDFYQLDDYSIPDNLLPIVSKLRNQEIMKITYDGGSMKNKERPIMPIGILPLPKGLVLQANCLFSETFKSFYLNKIKSFRFLDIEEQKEWQKGKNSK